MKRAARISYRLFAFFAGVLVAPWAAALLGLVSGLVCALAVSLKYRFGFDDSLDVVGVHFVGGWIGCLWIGLFGDSAVNALVENEGLFLGGGVSQLGIQALSALIVSAYSFALAFVIGFVINKTVGFRLSTEEEIDGIDLAEHAESAYDLSPSGGSGGGAFAMAGIKPGGSVAEDAPPVSEKISG